VFSDDYEGWLNLSAALVSPGDRRARIFAGGSRCNEAGYRGRSELGRGVRAAASPQWGGNVGQTPVAPVTCRRARRAWPLLVLRFNARTVGPEVECVPIRSVTVNCSYTPCPVIFEPVWTRTFVQDDGRTRRGLADHDFKSTLVTNGFEEPSVLRRLLIRMFMSIYLPTALDPEGSHGSEPTDDHPCLHPLSGRSRAKPSRRSRKE
jgi:hypothetical protein